MIHGATDCALASLSESRPSPWVPAMLELELTCTALTERVALISSVARVGPHTVSFQCEDYVRLTMYRSVPTTVAKGVMVLMY
jgi:D-aminopeptidase